MPMIRRHIRVRTRCLCAWMVAIESSDAPDIRTIGATRTCQRAPT